MADYWHTLSLSMVPLLSLASVYCFRTAIPMILTFEEERQPGRIESLLPLRGRWLRAGIGSLIMLAGLVLAAITPLAVIFALPVLFI